MHLLQNAGGKMCLEERLEGEGNSGEVESVPGGGYQWLDITHKWNQLLILSFCFQTWWKHGERIKFVNVVCNKILEIIFLSIWFSK